MEYEDLLSRDECRQIVAKDLPGRAFQVLEVRVRPFSDEATGFLSDQLRLTVSVRLEGEAERELQYFVKAFPKRVPDRVDFIAGLGAYGREVDFYSRLSAELLFDEVAGGDERYRSVPRFYLAREDLVALEDLTARGFTLVSSRQEFDYAHCGLVLRALAVFHAATLVHEARSGRRLGDDPRFRLEDALQRPVVVDGRPLEWVQGSYGAFRHLLPLLPGGYGADPALCRRMADTFPRLKRAAKDLVRRSERFRNVLCHGDFWPNNMMFRHQEGRPEAVRFVDFQFVRYAPPASDVLFFLQIATRRAFRERHEAALLREYHGELLRALARHGLGPEELSWEHFLASCAEMRQHARTMGAVYAMTVLVPPDFLSSKLNSKEDFHRFTFVDRGPEVCQCFLVDQLFRERVTELMQEFIDTCVMPLL